MARTKYEPRSFTSEPVAFGRARTIEWLPSPGAEADLIASQLQHELCVRINKAIAAKNHLGKLNSYARTLVGKPGDRDNEEYERAVRSAYDRLARILRGERILRLDDVARAKVHFGDALDLTDLFELQ